MATSEERLKNKIIKVMDECGKENDNPQDSKEKFAEALAKAVIHEIKQMTITATCSHGPVTVSNIE